jgi:two-component system response regulator YesN
VKILIVDDDRAVSDFFAHVAKVRGHEDIDTVYSGEEALTRVLRRDYDLITLDIRMPGLSGLEVVALLRTTCPHAVIAIISGYIPDEVPGEVAGCADVLLAKPVGTAVFSQLLDGVEEISRTLTRVRSLGAPLPRAR